MSVADVFRLEWPLLVATLMRDVGDPFEDSRLPRWAEQPFGAGFEVQRFVEMLKPAG